MQIFFFASLLAAAASSPLSASSPNGDNGASKTNVTSPFIKVRDVCVAKEHRMYTPAVVLIGTDNQLLRCVYEVPEQCEVLHTTGTQVDSLLVVGEFVYAGLYQKILKCKLNQAESCQTYQTCGTHVQSLTTANGNLYGGLENGTVLICELDDFNSCRPFHTFESAVYALMQENEYIFVGLWNGKVMRCSLGAGSNCTLMHTLSKGITGLSSVGNSIFAVSYSDHTILKCVRKTHSFESCESSPFGYNYPIDMATFNGLLYTAKDGGNIYICQWESNETCTEYRNNITTRCIAFSYATYAMESQYRGEDATCQRQSEQDACVPAVVYYNARQRAHLQVHVKDGRLINSQGALVDTSAADEGHSGPAAIFAMGPGGRILLSNLHKKGLLQTSSFFAGNPVAGAGEMVVKDGVIQKIRACSAHYRPDTDLNRQVVQSLRDQGYTDHIDSVMCSDDHGETNRSESNVQ